MAKTVLCILLSLVSSSLQILMSDKPNAVLTRQGVVSGQVLTSSNGKPYYSFTGIPYALPPVGELRFKPAQDYIPQPGVFNATNSHPMCTQTSLFAVGSPASGSEDCLYLNIYTPKLAQIAIPNQINSSGLPVMVYFHNDQYSFGDANFNSVNPSYFMNSNIVLVVANYRLGFLGFASSGDDALPANLGLKDQNYVIRWLFNSIAGFGGNPNKFTVFGEASGGVSAHLHALSPLSQPYINAAICQSGNALTPGVISSPEEGMANTRKIANNFNCPTENTTKMVQCLQKISASDLILSSKATFIVNSIYQLMPFRPVIELNVTDPFLPEAPEDIISSGKARNIALMMGITAQDGAHKAANIFSNPTLLQELNDDFNTVASISLYYDNARNPDLISYQLDDFYFNNEKIVNNRGFRVNVTNTYGDRLYLQSTNKALRLHRQFQNKPLYNYVYRYRGLSISSCQLIDPANVYGVCHTDELLSLFPPASIYNFTPNQADLNMSKALVELWTSFATDMEPRTTQFQRLWEQVVTDNLEYYLIIDGNNARMASKYRWKYYQFWNHADTE